MKTKEIRRFWVFFSLGLTLVAAGIILAGVWPRLFPSAYTSEVYKKYAHVDGIAATFLKNFQVNDSVSVDVTLLEAKDSAGWAQMQEDFRILPIPPELEMHFEDDGVEVWLAPKNNYHLPIDTVLLNNDVLSVSHSKKTLCVFATESEAQMEAVSWHQHFEGGHEPMKK